MSYHVKFVDGATQCTRPSCGVPRAIGVDVPATFFTTRYGCAGGKGLLCWWWCQGRKWLHNAGQGEATLPQQGAWMMGRAVVGNTCTAKAHVKHVTSQQQHTSFRHLQECGLDRHDLRFAQESNTDQRSVYYDVIYIATE